MIGQVLGLYEKGIGIAIKGVKKIDEELYNRYVEARNGVRPTKRSCCRDSKMRQLRNDTESDTSWRSFSARLQPNGRQPRRMKLTMMRMSGRRNGNSNGTWTIERLSALPVITPELEDQERPERLAVVLLARLMLGDAAGDGFGIEQALPLEALADRAARSSTGQAGRAASVPRECRTLSWAEPGSRPAAGLRGGALEQPLGLASGQLERRRQGLHEVDELARPETERGPRGRRPCWPGRPWSGCPREDTCPDREPASGKAASVPPANDPGAAEMLVLDADRVAAHEHLGDLGAGERAQPALVGEGQRLGRHLGGTA